MTNIIAVAEFRRLAPLLTANRILTAGNTELLAHYTMVGARITEAWVAGATPSGALLSVYRKMSGDFCLSSIAVPAPIGRPNPFLKLGKR